MSELDPRNVARPERFELPTLWFEARSRQISQSASASITLFYTKDTIRLRDAS